MSSSAPCAPSNTTDLAGVESLGHEPRGVGDVLLEPVPVGEVLLGHRLQVEPRVAREWAQRQPLGLERRDDLLLEDLRVEQVLDPDPQPRRLVGVARPDPPPRRPDLQLAELCLAGMVEHQVVGHDQVRVGGDLQRGRIDAPPAQLVELVGEHLRIDHDAVADHAQLSRVQDPRRHQVELPRLAAFDDRVAGVVAALEADDRVRPLGEQVGDLPLSFVAPLGADDHDSRHFARECTRAAPDAQTGRGSSRRSWPSSGSSSHISVRRETVRSVICSHSASRSRMFVVITIDRSSS